MIGTWGTAGVRCKIKSGYEQEGLEGEALCWVTTRTSGMRWIVVVWDDEDEPDLHKAHGLVLKHPDDKGWSDAKLS